jgi:hypothetical protein
VATRLKEAAEISKDHLAAAARNQAQGAQDIAAGVKPTSVAREHAKEAAADIRTWKDELKAAARGDLPGAAKVRDLPPLEPGEERVEDEVTARPTKAGKEGKGTGGPAPRPRSE